MPRSWMLGLFGLFTGTCVLVAASCGGTTGQPPSDNGSSGSADAAPPVPTNDATLTPAPDAGEFDVDVPSADAHRLDDVLTEAANAGEAAPPPWASWPVCPPDGIDNTSGAETWAAPDSGPCGSQVWVNPDCDNCIRSNAVGVFSVNGDVFPPCSNMRRDAGPFNGGPVPTVPQFDVCAAAFTCIVTTGCAAGAPITCYCGDAGVADSCKTGSANGACKQEIENLYWTDIPPPANSKADPGTIVGESASPLYAVGELLLLFSNAAPANANCPTCLYSPADAGSGDADASDADAQ